MTATAERGLEARPWANTVSVDTTGTSFLVISFGRGENAAAAREWLTEAAATGPVQWLTFEEFDDDTGRRLGWVFNSSLNGLRIMILGPQFDVLQSVAVARRSGALETEIQALITDTAELPIYCAHCRATGRVRGGAGDTVTCPGCARSLEVHPHLSGTRGSYLASDARARDLP